MTRWAIAKASFTASTFHGLPHIATASKPCLRWSWAVLFAGCLAAFFAQSHSLINKYLAHPVITEIHMNSGGHKFPAVSFCNLNAYKRSKLSKVPEMQTLMSAVAVANEIDSSSMAKIRRKRETNVESKCNAEADTYYNSMSDSCFFVFMPTDDKGGKFWEHGWGICANLSLAEGDGALASRLGWVLDFPTQAWVAGRAAVSTSKRAWTGVGKGEVETTEDLPGLLAHYELLNGTNSSTGILYYHQPNSTLLNLDKGSQHRYLAVHEQGQIENGKSDDRGYDDSDYVCEYFDPDTYTLPDGLGNFCA